jgi:2-desacetyl-2-hydroxyethyl bacteriochlorophyllide A dehydrogenase
MSLDALFDSAGKPPSASPGGRMRAVRITEDHEVDVVEVPVPPLAEGEVLVRPTMCGICGTDLHILHHGFPGTNYPVTPGHEFAGHVVSVAAGVTRVKEGDFVAVDPNVVCGQCRWCRAGRPNLCLYLSPIGVGRPGAAADFVAVPAGNAFKVRERMGAGVAALIEPLACVLNAVESSQGIRDRNVLVLGGGTMGLLTAIVCDSIGAGKVTLADPAQGKHDIARAAGIQNVLLPAALGTDCYDVVFEAAGARSALLQGIDLVEKTGVLVQVGVHDADATVPFKPFRIYERELRIIGSNSCADKFSAAVDMMPDIQSRAAILLGQTFPVWDFAAAVDSVSCGHDVKTQLVVS